jgi:hypothetical protein
MRYLGYLVDYVTIFIDVSGRISVISLLFVDVVRISKWVVRIVKIEVVRISIPFEIGPKSLRCIRPRIERALPRFARAHHIKQGSG